MPTLLLDFDGTLVDSMPHWAAKMKRIFQHRGASKALR